MNSDETKDWGDGVFGAKSGLFHGLSPFVMVENIFCIIFTFELVVRFGAYKNLISFFVDPVLWKWNMFDLVLVGMMIFENWLMSLFIDGKSNVRMFSVLRFLRFARITRVLRSMPELAMMVKSLAAATRSVSSTVALLVGFIYVVAIVVTQWGQKLDAAEGWDEDNSIYNLKDDLFGNLFVSSLTLLQLIVFDDSMGIIRQTLKKDGFYGILLFLYMIMGAFTILNMLIGVICEIVSDTKAKEEDKLMRRKVNELFKQFDIDMTGTITRDEYEAKKEIVGQLGFDPETCRIAFDLADINGTGMLEIGDFMSMCFKLSKDPDPYDVLMIKRNILKLFKSYGATKAAELAKVQERHDGNTAENANYVSEKKAKPKPKAKTKQKPSRKIPGKELAAFTVELSTSDSEEEQDEFSEGELELTAVPVPGALNGSDEASEDEGNNNLNDNLFKNGRKIVELVS
jgi:Ca2+-binding EF-hand superfamily protein